MTNPYSSPTTTQREDAKIAPLSGLMPIYCIWAIATVGGRIYSFAFGSGMTAMKSMALESGMAETLAEAVTVAKQLVAVNIAVGVAFALIGGGAGLAHESTTELGPDSVDGVLPVPDRPSRPVEHRRPTDETDRPVGDHDHSVLHSLLYDGLRRCTPLHRLAKEVRKQHLNTDGRLACRFGV